jgi:hypothetical protein
MNNPMSEIDFHRDDTQPAEFKNHRSNNRGSAIRRHVCVCVLSLLGFLAVAELSGARQRLNRYLNLPTIQTSAVSIAVTSLRNQDRHELLSERMGLGADFRTAPSRAISTAGIATVPGDSARLVITEVQTSNAGEVVDWEGGCPDWIELWNPGDQPFNASGWYLTDDLNTLFKWQIPELVLSPNERILVFASGLDFCDEDELHTNFRLSKSGETLALVRPDKTTIEQSVSVGMSSSPHGVTYGPSSHDPQPLVNPTPLKENTQAANGFTAPVVCTHNSCLFETHFTVSLSCSTDAAGIHYTTDGSMPSESNGQTYTQPLLISGTTVLRAQAVAANKVASKVLTRSYLNLNQLVNQPSNPAGFPGQWDETQADYEMDPRITKPHQAEIKAAITQLPMISVVANREDVFGTEGIYTNSWNRGFEWEVPAVMELLPHQDEVGFQAPFGLRLAGYESRRPDWKKHSLRLSFRSRYGLSVVEHPIFDSPTVDAPNRGTGPLREPAVALKENEDVSIDSTHGLQSKTSNRFDDVLLGKYGDKKTKYLWTIDGRGINVVHQATPFPTPRGKVVHTNLSRRASLGGEVWFESPETVSINPTSGRFGAAAGMTRMQWEAAIRYWESLGYKVNAFPGQDRCSSLMLRSTDDSWASHHPAVRSRAQYMRDQWARMTEQEMGQLAARGRFVHVCINGLYWGLYNLIERPDEEYLAHQLGGKEDDYITIRSRGRRIDTDEAGELLWNRITAVASSDLNDPAQFAELEELMDMVDLIDYCLLQMYAGNEDWALVNGNNMRVYRRRMNYAKLKFMLWDTDSTFASGWKNEDVDYPLPMEKSGKKGSFVHLFRQLMKSDKFRQMFADRVDKWCGTDGVLGSAACQRRYEALLNEIEPALIAESARWGDIHSEEPYTPMEHWQAQKQRMLQDWFPNRSGILLKELKQHGLTTDSLSPESPSEPAAL